MILVLSANLIISSVLAADSLEMSDPPSKWSRHISYVLGYKRLQDDWSPAQNQVEIGLLDFDIKRTNWPVSIAAQLLMSCSDDVPEQRGFRGSYSGTYEFNVGPRKIFENSSKFQPFLGGGLSVIGASTSTDLDWGYVQEDSDIGIGYYVEGGVYWPLGERFVPGLRGEYSSGDINLFGREIDAGGIHGMLMFGIHW